MRWRGTPWQVGSQRDVPETALRSPLEPWCAALSIVVPLWLTTWRLGDLAQWRDDLALVRSLGFVPAGGEGTLSALFGQLAALLPVGGRVARVALVSVVGASAASRLLYGLVRRLLDKSSATPHLSPPLALAAALTATLSPTWQAEGTAAGGSTVAAAIGLGALTTAVAKGKRDPRYWLVLGALGALMALESYRAGLALLAALTAAVIASRVLPSRRDLGLAVLAASAVVAIGLIPLVLRPLASRAWVDLGVDLSTDALVTADAVAERPGLLDAWFSEIGLICVVLAVGGGLWGLARSSTRPLVAGLGVLVAADALYPASGGGVLAADPLAPVRLLAVAALSAATALAVHTGALALMRARLPMARPAAVMLVVFDLTLALSTSDQSATIAEQRARPATDLWTDAALGALPPESLVLVRSPPVVWRLWAARVLRGSRPDVLVVPMPMLSRGSVAARLLDAEPDLAPVIREISVNGRPSEYALSSLADARALYVELDPQWDRRLMDHMAPQPLWVGFAPHALGRSDRKAAMEAGRGAFRRVLETARKLPHRDRATLAMLGARAREQAIVLAALGDRTGVGTVLRDLRATDAQGAFVSELEKRLDKDRRGRIDVAGLVEQTSW